MEQEAHGEFASACPGSCGAPATFSVGTLPGVGRLSQPTFSETDAQLGFAQLSDRKTALPAAELLHDQGVPILEAHAVPLSRLLTARGSEDWGSPDRHEEERYWARDNSDQPRTKVKSPPTTGSVERLHKTRRTACSRITLRKKSYLQRADLQAARARGLREDTVMS